MAFYPYLFFGGNCREAFTRYQEIFGGELFVQTMDQMPEGEEVPPGSEDMVIHAALTMGDALLMGSDDPTTDDFGPVQGMMVSYGTKELEEAKNVFEALSDGGQVTQQLEPTFFSPGFGMCVDRFGTPWMISVEREESS